MPAPHLCRPCYRHATSPGPRLGDGIMGLEVIELRPFALLEMRVS
jgi:hypothetical protein